MTDETKRVARKVTQEMLDAGRAVIYGPDPAASDAWRAMFDAAPAAAPSDRERELEMALRLYGRHALSCPAKGKESPPWPDCNCGYGRALPTAPLPQEVE